jgi:hypothetical protein
MPMGVNHMKMPTSRIITASRMMKNLLCKFWKLNSVNWNKKLLHNDAGPFAQLGNDNAKTGAKNDDP